MYKGEIGGPETIKLETSSRSKEKRVITKYQYSEYTNNQKILIFGGGYLDVTL